MSHSGTRPQNIWQYVQAFLANPRTASLKDTNGNVIFLLTPTASAVNYLETVNSVDPDPIIVKPNGASADIALWLFGKGAGEVLANGNRIAPMDAQGRLTYTRLSALYGRRRLMQYLKDPAATTFTTLGFKAAPTQNGTVSNGDVNAAGALGAFTTAATTGARGGLVSASFDYFKRGWSPWFGCSLRTGTSASNIRIVCGLTSADMSGKTAPTTEEVAMMIYGTDSHGTAFYRCVSSNGSNVETTASSLGVGTTTLYEPEILLDTSAGKALFFSDGVLLAEHSTYIPQVATNLGWQVECTTLENAAKQIRVGHVSASHL